jgi:DNA polymerase-3 subunit gamma/tau
LRQLVTELVGYFRDLLLLRVCRQGADLVMVPEGSMDRVKSQAAEMDEGRIAAVAGILSETERELRRSEQQRLTLELAMVRLAQGQAEPEAPSEAARPAAAPAHAVQPSKPSRAKTAERSHAGRAARAGSETSGKAGGRASEGAERPGATGGEMAGELTLEAFQQLWPGLLEKLRSQRQSTLAAFLAESVPVEFNGNRLVVGFNHEFHWNQMTKSVERQKIVSDLIAAEAGREVGIEYRMLDAEQRQPQAGKDDSVRNIMDMFPGSEIV